MAARSASRQRDQTLIDQVAVRAPGGVAGEGRDEFLDARDHANMLLLHIEEERTRNRIVARGNRFKLGCRCRRLRPFTLSEFWSRKLNPKMPKASGLASSFWTIRLSFSPASTKTPSSRMAWQAFFARPSSLAPASVLAAAFHGDLDERVARAARRRRAEDFDLQVRQ